MVSWLNRLMAVVLSGFVLAALCAIVAALWPVLGVQAWVNAQLAAFSEVANGANSDAVAQAELALLDLQRRNKWMLGLAMLCVAMVAVGLVGALWWMITRVLRPLQALLKGAAAARVGGTMPALPAHEGLRDLSAALTLLHDQQGSRERVGYTDRITGLGSRGYFEQQLQRRLKNLQNESQSDTGGGFVVVLHCTNADELLEAYGSEARNLALRHLGEHLEANVGKDALCSHYSLGRYCFVMRAAASGAGRASVIAALEDLRERLQAPLPLARQLSIRATLRAGVSPMDAYETHPAAHLDRAESAALRQGHSDQWLQWYEASHANSLRQQLEVLAEIDRAIAEQQFTVVFEPLVDVYRCVVAGMESLARWQHPKRGLLGPGHFIPAAERTGRLPDIDTLILLQASQHLQSFRQQRPDLILSFNMSALDVVRDAERRIDRALLTSGLPGNALSMELTETAAASNADATAKTLQAIAERGVVVCLDDFGTGHSSLSYLLTMPAKKIKLDRSFVSKIGIEPAAERILEATLQLAAQLQLQVVAEGVETVVQMRWLMARGCFLHQGWLYSPPRGAKEFAWWMDQSPELFRRLMSEPLPDGYRGDGSGHNLSLPFSALEPTARPH